MSTLEHTFQKGKAEGQAETILRMLELRFSSVPEAVRQAVLNGSAEQLSKWTDRLLTAARPEDLVSDNS